MLTSLPVGRNISYMELMVTIATLFRRYNFEFETSGFELLTTDTVNAHPGPMPMRLTRRHVDDLLLEKQ